MGNSWYPWHINFLGSCHWTNLGFCWKFGWVSRAEVIAWSWLWVVLQQNSKRWLYIASTSRGQTESKLANCMGCWGSFFDPLLSQSGNCSSGVIRRVQGTVLVHLTLCGSGPDVWYSILLAHAGFYRKVCQWLVQRSGKLLQYGW